MFKPYFLEIRNRLSLIISSWILTLSVCYYYKKILLFIFIKPLASVYPEIYKGFIATNLIEIFSSYVLISFFVCNQLMIFVVVYHLLIFFSPALYKFEYRKIKNLVYFSCFLWFLNIVILNNFVFPYVFNFFLSFQGAVCDKIISVHFDIKISEYVHLYVHIFYFSALCFQFFLVIFLFLNSISNKKKFIKKYRKFFFFFFFSLATLVSPPDIFSQLILGFFFILVFELLIISIFWKYNFNKVF